jgi:prephenate dehydratase
MEIIAANIETNPKNYTRFVILCKQVDRTKHYNKASLALTLPHKKGSLSIILNIISFFNIDLTKIESVPIIGEPWHYLFYLDVVFQSELNYKQMLLALNPLADHIQVLGEYTSGNQSLNQIHTN